MLSIGPVFEVIGDSRISSRATLFFCLSGSRDTIIIAEMGRLLVFTLCRQSLTLSILRSAERRKIERRLRRLEKQQRTVGDQVSAADSGALSQELSDLKEDLEYVRVCMRLHARLVSVSVTKSFRA